MAFEELFGSTSVVALNQRRLGNLCHPAASMDSHVGARIDPSPPSEDTHTASNADYGV